MTGTNLGGWLVLEPWITPSLFYQFLSSDDDWGTDAPTHTGMDSYTFCRTRTRGGQQANAAALEGMGARGGHRDDRQVGATHVHIPVGDWMYQPYRALHRVHGWRARGARSRPRPVQEIPSRRAPRHPRCQGVAERLRQLGPGSRSEVDVGDCRAESRGHYHLRALADPRGTGPTISTSRR